MTDRSISEKTCSRCKSVKPVSEFHHNRTSGDGYSAQCKDCIKTYTIRYVENNKSGARRHDQPGQKLCHTCNTVKPTTGFCQNVWHKDGRSTRCKECQSKYQREQRKRYKAKNSLEAVCVREKKCYVCKLIKSADEFYPNLNKHDGLASDCKSCAKVKKQKWGRTYSRKLKLKIMGHYSNGTNQCACCGETMIEFLTIDHVHNDGAQHRKSLTMTLYAWLEKNNFPLGFQVLCMNCNFVKGKFGGCPHAKLRVA